MPSRRRRLVRKISAGSLDSAKAQVLRSRALAERRHGQVQQGVPRGFEDYIGAP